LVAALSKDPIVIGNFTEGLDFHSILATESYQVIFNTTEVVSKVKIPYKDSDFRTIHKRINFGILYGCSPKRVSQVLGIPIKQATECFNRIKLRVPVLMNYLKDNMDKSAKLGYIQSTLTGDFAIGVSGTQAANFEIQNANAVAMCRALWKAREYILDNNLENDVKILMTVHDSLVIQFRDGIDPQPFVNIVQDALGYYLNGIVPSAADISVNTYLEK
jgi:DNA polymerase I-like protein with 3'-5' exonuclease and polymerase domains